MKKLVLLLSFVLIGNVLFAQYTTFQLGIQVKPTLSWFSAKDVGLKSEGASLGFNGGLIGEINFTKNYLILSGINFSFSKGKVSYQGNGNYGNIAPHFSNQIVNINETVSFQYVEVPIALKLRTNELFPETRFFGLFGINSAFCVSAKSNKVLTLNNERIDAKKVDVKDDYALFKESLILGIGTEFNIDKTSYVSIGVNFNTALNNIAKYHYTYEGESRKAKLTLSYIELCAAFVF